MSIDDESGFGKSFGDKTRVREVTAELGTLYAVQLVPDGSRDPHVQYEFFSIVAVNCGNISGKTRM